MDIGPFLLSLDKVPQNCQYIYKLHTKKNDKWRSELFDGLPLNPNSKVIYGTQKWVYKDHQYYKKDKILKLCIKLGFRYPNIVFLAGTVFCIKKDILFKWFFEKRFEIYELLEEGFTSDKKNSTWTHALERVLSSLCYLEKDTLWDLSIPKNYNWKNIVINYGFDESKLPNIKKKQKYNCNQ